jgi:two-component system LytT family response regulator
MIRTILIDDEPHALGNLEFMLKKYCNNIEIKGLFSDAQTALEQFYQHQPELIFLDIEMPGENGFDFLAQINKQHCEVIFVTGYEQFALRAIKNNALDYLLKPLDRNELVKAVEKSQQVISRKKEYSILAGSPPKKTPEDTRLAIPTFEGMSFVDTKEIMYCASEGRYTIIYLENKKKITVSKNLGAYEQLLQPFQFIRLHNEYLVNPLFIRQYVRGRGGYVVLKNGQSIGVAARRKISFLEKFSPTGLNG